SHVGVHIFAHGINGGYFNAFSIVIIPVSELIIVFFKQYGIYLKRGMWNVVRDITEKRFILFSVDKRNRFIGQDICDITFCRKRFSFLFQDRIKIVAQMPSFKSNKFIKSLPV